jgi:hypothetical protein
LTSRNQGGPRDILKVIDIDRGHFELDPTVAISVENLFRPHSHKKIRQRPSMNNELYN